MKRAFLIAATLFSGCASLHSQISQFTIGTPADTVQDSLGVPNDLRIFTLPSGDVATSWLFDQRGEICTIVIVQDQVATKPICQKSTSSKTTGQKVLIGIGSFFQGFTDGMNESRQNNIQCTTTGGSGTYYSNCR